MIGKYFCPRAVFIKNWNLKATFFFKTVPQNYNFKLDTLTRLGCQIRPAGRTLPCLGIQNNRTFFISGRRFESREGIRVEADRQVRRVGQRHDGLRHQAHANPS